MCNSVCLLAEDKEKFERENLKLERKKRRLLEKVQEIEKRIAFNNLRMEGGECFNDRCVDLVDGVFSGEVIDV